MAEDRFSRNRQLAYDLLKKEGYTDIGDSAEKLFEKRSNAELAYKLLRQAGYTDLGKDYNEFAGKLYAPDTTATSPAAPVVQSTVDKNAAASATSVAPAPAPAPPVKAEPVAEPAAQAEDGGTKVFASPAPESGQGYKKRAGAEPIRGADGYRVTSRARYADVDSGFSPEEAMTVGEQAEEYFREAATYKDQLEAFKKKWSGLEKRLAEAKNGGVSVSTQEEADALNGQIRQYNKERSRLASITKRQEKLMSTPAGKQYEELMGRLNEVESAPVTPESQFERTKVISDLYRNPVFRASIDGRVPSESEISFGLLRAEQDYIDAALESTDRSLKKQLKARKEELKGEILNNEYYQKDVARRLDKARKKLADIDGELKRDNVAPKSFSKGAVAAKYRPVSPEAEKKRDNLVAAKLSLQEEVKRLEHIQKRDIGDFWVQFANVFTNPNTYTFNLVNLAERVASLRAFNDKDIPGAKVLLDAVTEKNATSQEEEQLIGKEGRWGRIAGEAIPFAAGIRITGGFDKVAKGVTAGVSKAVGNEAAERFLVKALGVTLGDVAAGAVSANTVGLGQTASDFLDNYFGQLVKNEDGEYKFVEGNHNAALSGYKAEAGNIIEYWSERVGDHLQHLTGRAVLAGKSAFTRNPVVRGEVSQLRQAIASTMDVSLKDLGYRQIAKEGAASVAQKVMSNSAKLLSRFGVQGYPFEVAEEEINILASALLHTGDGSYGSELKGLVDPEQQADIWGGMLYSIGLMQGASVGIAGARSVKGAVNNAKTYLDLEAGLDERSAFASEILGGNWEGVKAQVDATPNEDIPSLVSQYMKDDSLSSQEKSAILDYVRNLYVYRGYNEGSVWSANNSMTEAGARVFGEPLETLNVSDDVLMAGKQVSDAYMMGYLMTSPDSAEDIERAVQTQRARLQQTFGVDDIPEGLEQSYFSEPRADVAIDYLMAKAVQAGHEAAATDRHLKKKAIAQAQLEKAYGGPVRKILPEGTPEPAGGVIEAGFVDGSDGNPMLVFFLSDELVNGKRMYRGSDGRVGYASREDVYSLDEAGNKIVGQTEVSDFDDFLEREVQRREAAEAAQAEVEDEAKRVARETAQAASEEEQLAMQLMGEQTIYENGQPVSVNVTEVGDGNVGYEYTDANGKTKVGTKSISDFQQAMQQPQSPAPEEAPAEAAGSQPAAEEPQAGPSLPKDKKTGETDWTATIDASPEEFANYLPALIAEMPNFFANPLESARKWYAQAGEKIKELTEKIKKETDPNKEAKLNRELKAWQNRRANAQALFMALSPKQEPRPATTAAEAEAPEAPEAPVEADVPEMSSDTPEAARKRGYIKQAGQRIDRAAEDAVAETGAKVKIAFTKSEKGVVDGTYGLVESKRIIPSHINDQENPLHFFARDWQPKDRKKADSASAIQVMANGLRPAEITEGATAYVGAPIVNARGEVIQGNGRSEALRRAYQQGSAAEYKAWLADNAEKFGLTREQVESLENPVLVRALDVDDATAGELGQKSQADLESGGDQTFSAGALAKKLGDKLEDLIEILFRGELGDDATLTDYINANGQLALQWLHRNGYINDTEYQNALKPDNSGFTESTLTAFRDMGKELLVGNSAPAVAEGYKDLQNNAKLALQRNVVLLSRLDGVLPDIREALAYYHDFLSGDPAFRNAKSVEDAQKAIQDWMNNIQLDGQSEAELHPNEAARAFAARLKGTTTIKGLTDLFRALAAAMQGEVGVFGETEGVDRESAYKQLGILSNDEKQTDNGQQQDTQGSDSSGDDAGEPGGRGREELPGGNGEVPAGRKEGDAGDAGGNRRETVASGKTSAPSEGGAQTSSSKEKNTSDNSGKSVSSQKEEAPAEPEAPRELTEEEIRNSGYADEDVIDAAVDYINGNHGFAETLAYNQIVEYVRSQRRTTEQTGGNADGAQLDGPVVRPAGVGAEQTGGDSGQVADGQEEGPAERIPGPEDGGVPSGVQGDSNAEGVGLQDNVPGPGGERHRGGNRAGENGRSSDDGGAGSQPAAVSGQSGEQGPAAESGAVPGDRGRSEGGERRSAGGRVAPEGGAGTGSTATAAGSTDIDALGGELADLLKQFSETSPSIDRDINGLDSVSHSVDVEQKEGELSRKQAKKPTVPLSLEGLSPKQMQLAGQILFSAAKLGYAFAKTEGLTAFNDFRRWFTSKFGDAVMKGLNYSESSLDAFIREVWNTKMKIDGERLTLEQHSQELHNAELREEAKKSNAERTALQKQANEKKVPFKAANRKNIAETLPQLIPGQWDDVVAIERQFFDPSHNDYDHAYGKGMLITNGTGTGKTFTGLGVIKRFLDQGKKRILLVAPAAMTGEWVDKAKIMGIEATKLANTKDKGKGVVVTSYENFRENYALYEDDFDLVVYDESQNIIENQKGEDTLAYEAHRRITNKNVEEATERLVAGTVPGRRRIELLNEQKALEAEAKKPRTKEKRQQEIILRKDEIEVELQGLENEIALLKPQFKEKAEAAVKKTKVLFLSATPFNTINNLRYAEGYIFQTPRVFKSDGTEVTDEGSRWSAFNTEWFRGDEPMEDMEIAFGDHLLDELETASFRELENGYDHSRDFPDVSGNVMASRFNAAWQAIQKDSRFSALREFAGFLTDPTWTTQLFETMKASALRDRLKEHLDAGRKVVIFHDRVHETQSTERRPAVGPPFATVLDVAMSASNNERPVPVMAITEFRRQFADVLAWEKTLDYRPVHEQVVDFYATDADRARYAKEMEEYQKKEEKWVEECRQIERTFAHLSPEEIMEKMPKAPKRPQLQAESVAIYNGEKTNKEKDEAKAAFNDDNSKVKIICVTTRSGGAGLSLHDTTGKHPRVMIQTALPISPIGFIQAEGRIFRWGNRSNAVFEYPRLGIDLEAYVFAVNFNAKAETVENLAHGFRGRGLKDSIMTGFYENSGNVPIDGQGIGGVEMDKRGNTLKGMAKAKHDYGVAQRKGIREGDYSIPEPIGFKMAEWANAMAGDSALIPFAGRGSIARYVPKGVSISALEQNVALQADLMVTSGGADFKLREGTFTELNLINKADVVLLNGATEEGLSQAGALKKGFGHLSEGGRLIAIVPDNAGTNTVLAEIGTQGGVLRASIKIADKEGTSRIVVVDKISNSELRKKAGQTITHDLSNVTEEQMFDLLDKIALPERIIDRDAIIAKKVRALATEFNKNRFVEGFKVEEGYRPYIRINYRRKPNGFSYAKRALRVIERNSYYDRGSGEYIEMREFNNPSPNHRYIRTYKLISELLQGDDAEFRKFAQIEDNAKQEDVDALKDLYRSYQKLIRAAFGLTESQIKRVMQGLQPDVSASDIDTLNNYDELRAKFEAANHDDAERQELYDKVASVGEKIGLTIGTEAMDRDFLGGYNNKDNSLKINKLRWNGLTDDKRATTLLHEFIHSVTVYAIAGYDTNAPGMSDELFNAAKLASDVYDQVQRGAPQDVRPFTGFYAIENTKEILAEMANPEFREKLKNRRMWVIRSSRGIRVSGAEMEGAEQTTAWALLNEAVDGMLKNFDKDLFDRFRGRSSDFFWNLDREGRYMREADNGRADDNFGKNTIFVANENNGDRARTSQNATGEGGRNGANVDGRDARKVEISRDKGRIRVLETEVAPSQREYPGGSEGDYARRVDQQKEGQRLIDAAKANGLFIEPGAYSNLSRVNHQSRESVVYHDKVNGRAVKIMDPFAAEPMTNNSPFDELYRHIIHNIYFPESRYEFLGVTTNARGDEVRFVLSQPWVESYERVPDAEADSFIKKHGFGPLDGYKRQNENVIVFDFYGGNILKDVDGNIHLIDPLISFKKAPRTIIDEFLGDDGSVSNEDDIRYREENDADVLERLDSEPTVKAYRAMQFIPEPNGEWEFDLGDGNGMQRGNLYPPMSAKVNGEWRNPVRRQTWERSVEQPELAREDGTFLLDKGNKKSVPAAYNPYFHSSATMLNDQFSEAQSRNNLVVVEVEIPEREVSARNINPYKAEKAKDAVGVHEWKAGPIQGQLSGTRSVYLSRWDKPMRIVPVDEVAYNVEKMIRGQVEVMPSNVVWPQLRNELEKLGVKFVETNNQGKLANGKYYASEYKKTRTKEEQKAAKQARDERAAAVERLRDAERKATEDTLERMSEELGIKVNRVSRDEMPKGHKSNKGYYNPSTGEMTICMDNVTDERDAIATVLHETVAHHGLRRLFGDRFNEAMVRIYGALDANGRAWVNGYMERHNLKPGDAGVITGVEEYLAHLAESGDFKSSLWQRIKDAFCRIIDKIFGLDGFVLTNRELQYILRASYENLKNPGWLNTVEGEAMDTLLKREGGFNETDSRYPTDPDAQDAGLLFRDGAPDTALGRYEGRLKDWRVAAVMEHQNSDLPVKIAYEEIQKETGKDSVEENEDYLTRHNLSSSRAETEFHEYELRHFKPMLEQVRSIQEKIMNKQAATGRIADAREAAYERVLDYLYAVSALERNDYKNNEIEQAKQLALAGVTDPADVAKIEDRYESMKRDWSGITSLMGDVDWRSAEGKARQMIDTFKTDVADDAALDELWDRIRGCTDYNLEHAYRHGLLTREEFERLHGTSSQPRMWEYYLPLRGFSAETAEETYGYDTLVRPRSNSVVVKKMEGRWTQADNPLANILNIAETEIVQGNENWAKQALYRFLVNAGDNSLMNVREPWYVKNPADGTWSLAEPYDDETLEEFDERMRALRDNIQSDGTQGEPLAKQGRNGLALDKIMVNKGHRNEHLIRLKVGGVEKAIWVNGNPAIAKAVSGIGRAKNMQLIRRASRALSNLFTTYSLDFTARNLIRDTIYSRIALNIKEDGAYRHQYRKNWWNNFGYGAFAFPMVRLMSQWENGSLQKKANPSAREQMFMDFMRDGGQTGYTIINSVDQIKKSLERTMRQAGKKVSTVRVPILGHYAEFVKTLNEAFELLTRFTAYQTSRDMGRSGQRAASDAKEISVNFNRKGMQSGEGFWGAAAAYLGATHYFYNAGVQGFDNFLRLFKTSPVKAGVATGAFALMGILTPILNAALAGLFAADGDDDDKKKYDWYWNLPEWVRRNNIVLGTGSWYLAVPLPVELRAFYGIGDIAGSLMYGKAPGKSGFDIGLDAVNTMANVLPVNPVEGVSSNGNFGDALIRAAVPDATMFFVDWATNRDYTGRPLWKENTFNNTTPKSQGAYASTPKAIVDACQWMAKNYGVDVAPGLVRDFFKNYGGGFYNAAEDVSKMLFTDDERPFRYDNIPFFSGFTGHIDEDRSNTFVTNALYAYGKKSDDVVRRLNMAANTKDITASMAFDHPEDMPAGARVQKILEGEDYILAKMYRDGMNNEYVMKVHASGKNAGKEYKSKEIKRKGLKTLKKEWTDLREQWLSMPDKTAEEKSAKAEAELAVQDAWHTYYSAQADLVDRLMEEEYNHVQRKQANGTPYNRKQSLTEKAYNAAKDIVK